MIFLRSKKSQKQCAGVIFNHSCLLISSRRNKNYLRRRVYKEKICSKIIFRESLTLSKMNPLPVFIHWTEPYLNTLNGIIPYPNTKPILIHCPCWYIAELYLILKHGLKTLLGSHGLNPIVVQRGFPLPPPSLPTSPPCFTF